MCRCLCAGAESVKCEMDDAKGGTEAEYRRRIINQIKADHEVAKLGLWCREL